MFKGNLCGSVKGVIIGKPPAVLTFAVGFLSWSLFAYFVYSASCTAQQRRIPSTLCKMLRNKSLHQAVKKSKKMEVKFFYRSLLCPLFLLLFPMSSGFCLMPVLGFTKWPFLQISKGFLCHQTCQGVQYCISLLNGMTTLTCT